MQVLMQTFGSAGDVDPMVAVGAALKARGHDVGVVVNEAFAPSVERAGLEPLVVGTAEEFHEASKHPDLWHPQKGLSVVLDGLFLGLKPTIDLLRERLTDDTVLVGSTLGAAARMVRELEDVPLVTLHLAPIAFKSIHRSPRFAGSAMHEGVPRLLVRLQWWMIEGISDRIVRKRLDPARKEYGLKPVKRIFYDWIHSPDRIVGLFPDWFGPPQPDWPGNVELAGFALTKAGGELSPELAAWLDEGDAPIVFTHGSAQQRSQNFFAASADAAARLDRRALLVTRNRDSAPATLPDGVRYESYVPFAALLPRAAMFVSHGGIGSCAAALAAGVPHLAAPLSFDQFDNGSRLVDLAAGNVLPASRYTAEAAANALAALDATPREPCMRAAEMLQSEDGAEQAARLIEAAQ